MMALSDVLGQELAPAQSRWNVSWGQQGRKTAHQRTRGALPGGGVGSGALSLSAAFPAPLQQETRTCPRHGPYTAKLVQVIASRPAAWTGCPGCRAEQDAAEQRAAVLASQQEAAARAAERRAQAFAEVLGRAMFPKRYASATLQTWRTTDDPGQARALHRARWFVDTWPERLEQGSNLLFCGGVGTGKTRLAVAIGREVIERGGSCVYADMQEIATALRATWSRTSSKTEGEVLRDCVAPQLLILDEVGRQLGGTAFDVQALFAVVNSRYRECLPTLIISNMTVTEFVQYAGEAVADRLREGGKAVKFEWHSLRGGDGDV